MNSFFCVSFTYRLNAQKNTNMNKWFYYYIYLFIMYILFHFYFLLFSYFSFHFKILLFFSIKGFKKFQTTIINIFVYFILFIIIIIFLLPILGFTRRPLLKLRLEACTTPGGTPNGLQHDTRPNDSTHGVATPIQNLSANLFRRFRLTPDEFYDRTSWVG
jgi:hypothetical protein